MDRDRIFNNVALPDARAARDHLLRNLPSFKRLVERVAGQL